jgi:hypothetical protein
MFHVEHGATAQQGNSHSRIMAGSRAIARYTHMDK